MLPSRWPSPHSPDPRRTITRMRGSAFDQVVAAPVPRAHGARGGRRLVPGLDVTYVINPEYGHETTLPCCSCASTWRTTAYPARTAMWCSTSAWVEELIERGTDCPRVRSRRRDRPRGGQGHRRQRGPRARDGKHVPVSSAMGESRHELFSTASSEEVFAGSTSGSRDGLVNEYYERRSADHRRWRHGVVRVDIGSMYATRDDNQSRTSPRTKSGSPAPGLDVRVEGLAPRGVSPRNRSWAASVLATG